MAQNYSKNVQEALAGFNKLTEAEKAEFLSALKKETTTTKPNKTKLQI